MAAPTGLSLATKGILCAGGRSVTKYAGFIRREDALAQPIIKVEKFYIDGDDSAEITMEKNRKIEIKEVQFIEKI